MKEYKREGIAVVGSVLVDKINEIKAYPESGELTQIVGLDRSVGGCVPNVSVDLAKICPNLPVYAIGKIGNDDEGSYVTEVLSNAGVNVEGITVMEGERTSFTEVMSVQNGQRTFFVYPGASADFGYDDIAFDNVVAKIFHLGYFLLLQKIDDGDGLRILQKAQQLGMKTSIDMVSENSDRYSLVIPCLAYTDYLIINEHEAGKLTGIEPTENNLEEIAKRLQALGVREKVIIHMPMKAICLSGDTITEVGSYLLPDDFIAGTTGAGDAFCSGCLIGIYEGMSDREMLEFASACSVMALRKADATSGIVTKDEMLKFCEQFDRR